MNNGFLARLVPDKSPFDLGGEDLIQLGVNVINFLIDISLVIATIFFLWGGLLFIISGGSEERISKGRQAMTAAVIGIVIVLASILIVNTFLEWFTICNIDFGNPTNIGADGC